MEIKFKANNNTDFSLGSVSFNFLDKKSVFDNYQQDHDEHSIVILEVLSTDVRDLSRDVIVAVESEPQLRVDIAEKLKNFAEWLKESQGFKTFIL